VVIDEFVVELEVVDVAKDEDVLFLGGWSMLAQVHLEWH
jgi:hypothetical protein